MHFTMRRTLCGAALLSLACAGLPAASAHDGNHSMSMAPGQIMVHSAEYRVPDVWQVRDDGKRVRLAQELDDGRPVVLNFVYTTCPGICPMMSQVFSQFQTRAGAERERMHMVSISIDPEQDTPARLRKYAKKFSAGSQWQHYTGTVADSVALQKAFDAYRGDKMSHDPLTLIRAAPGSPWVRVEGLASADEVLKQYRSALTTARVALR